MKRLFILLLLGSSVLSFSVSCYKEDISDTDDTRASGQIISTKSGDSTNEELVTSYFDNIKTIIYATEAYNVSDPFALLDYEDLQDSSSCANLNPMTIKLYYTDFEDELTGNPIDFFSLSLAQKQYLVDEVLTIERQQMLDKLNQVDDLTDYVSVAVQAMDSVINEFSMPLRSLAPFVSPITPQDSVIALGHAGGIGAGLYDYEPHPYIDYYLTESQKQQVFADIREGIENGLAWQAPSSGGGGNTTISAAAVKNMWRTVGSKGDILLALPVFGYPWAYISFSDPWHVGHAGILKNNITSSTGQYDNVTVECWVENGVTYKTINTWRHPHYLLGLGKIKYVVRYIGIFPRLTAVFTSVSNPQQLADFACTQYGHQYVRWYEFLTSKWAAPTRYTCTTLVWWAAKQKYGLNLSSWLSPLVTPSDIYLSSNTIIKGYVY